MKVTRAPELYVLDTWPPDGGALLEVVEPFGHGVLRTVGGTALKGPPLVLTGFSSLLLD